MKVKVSDYGLTDAERELVETFPHLPDQATVRTTNVWIIEWLSAGEKRTGRELHEWMENRRTGWSIFCPCHTKAEVLESIARAERCAKESGIFPVLHIEAHGSEDGLSPSPEQNSELLSWDELTVPLQLLNRATRCNLVVFVAACIGFAALQALSQGPYAPAVAIVGPDAEVLPGHLLEGTKEFYRGWTADNPTLGEIVQSASLETGASHFEWEPFSTFCYEAMTENLIRSIRPDERAERFGRLCARLAEETELSNSEIDERLEELPLVSSWEHQQGLWDQMFMIDIWPENKVRFGVDWKKITDIVNSMATARAS